MANESISRRDILRTLAVGAVGGSVLQVIPAEAAEYVHQMVHKEKLRPRQGSTHPNIFPPRNTPRCFFCATPSSPRIKVRWRRRSGRAGIHRSAHRENPGYQLRLGGDSSGSTALARIVTRNVFMECTPEQRRRSWT